MSRSICALLASSPTACTTVGSAIGERMAKARRPDVVPERPRATHQTDDFRSWERTLSAERRAKVSAAIDHVVASGPNLGFPHVEKIKWTNVHRLKEVRVDRGIRVLFAFDSNRDAVMLVGGDKTGKWNGWYRPNIERAEHLYADHERSIGKEPRCLSQRAAGRKSRGRSR
jgi:hypothetical protein